TLEDGPDVPEVENFAPSVEELAQVEQEYITRNCRQAGENAPGSDEVTLCEDPEAPENPSKTIVLAPDSHAGHSEQTFRQLGREHNWRSEERRVGKACRSRGRAEHEKRERRRG